METILEPTKKRRSSRRLDKKQIEQIVKLRNEKDLTITQIAPMYGKDPSTIFRVLEKNSDEYKALQRFKGNEVDLLDSVRYKNLRLRSALYDSIEEDNYSAVCNLAVDKKIQLIHPLTVDSGIDTEKSLLLQGKATQILDQRSLTVHLQDRLNHLDKALESAQIIDNEAPVDVSNVDNSCK